MPDINTTNFMRDFEQTLGALDSALNDAVRAVAAMRAFVPQINMLAQAVVTIESAVTQARQNIDVEGPPPTAQATLHAIQPTPLPATGQQQEQPTTEAGTQCLRLQVTKTSGPLDLKNVDNAVNEHPEIVDLALLDYDGRQATLKVWVSGGTDRKQLEQSLTDDLLKRVGESAEVTITADQESAAA
jgi:hypothetical protein